MRALHVLAVAVALALALGHTASARAFQAPPPAPHAPDEATADDRTPPRLSYVDGQVSFWRPGAPEWVVAQVNTALAPGDELSTGSPGNVEVQVGARAFLRAWAGTAVGLMNQEPDFLQVKVTAGHAALDLRALDPGRVVEVNTPNAAFTIEHPGYYRVHVIGPRTSFTSRRGGRAIVTPAHGQALRIAASEEVVIEGDDAPRVASYAAPPLDEWDRWNYTRTDYLADAVSARYVSSGVYGVSDLDRHGRWRVVPDYGSVWVPTSVAPDWVPYSTGSWTWDPSYGWTWVDTAPWGWAPFHYGRWVYVDRYWAWAPGPVIVRPAYSPALVAFFGGGPSVSVRVGWVALGWGEPVIPWWGRPRFVGVPWWGGWGGPRVNVQNINVYRNVHVHNAVVAVEPQRFGRGGSVGTHRMAQIEVSRLEPVRGRLDIQPAAVSLVPTTVRGVPPSDNRHTRPVVATRPPQRWESPGGESGPRGPAREAAPSPRLVPAPRENAAVESPRPPFGPGRTERPQPPPAPRFGGGQPRSPAVVVPPSREQRVTAPTPQPSPPGEGSRPVVRPEGVKPERPAAVPPSSPPGRELRSVTPAAPAAPQTPAPRIETPRQQETPRMQAPAPQGPREAPRVQGPAPQGPRETPRVQVPAPQGQVRVPPRVEDARPQGRALPGEAADRMSPGRGGGNSR